MSRNTFTITVILKAFFADCRSQAKIFINENIKTILDLENKISRIFGIKNFYLVSSDKLLPQCEDIRLLENGNIVCVLPNDSESKLLLLPERYYCTNNEAVECKKKKRLSLIDECPIKEKKCKKKKKKTSDEKLLELLEHQVPKKIKQFSPDKIKIKKEKNVVSTNKSNRTEPKQNECLLFTSTPNDIKNNTFPSVVFINGKKHTTENEHKNVKKKRKKDDEQECSKNSEKSTNIQLLYDDVGINSELKIATENCSKIVTQNVEEESTITCFVTYQNYVQPVNITDCHPANNIEPESTNEIKKNSKVNSQANYFPLKMIVDSSESSTDNEIERDMGNKTGSETVGKSNSKTNKVEMEKNEILENSTNRSSLKLSSKNENYSDETQKKSCPLYTLPKRKKNWKSWSTSPLLKTTNHVKIDRIPITAVDLDLSKFVFRPSDVGAVPIPNTLGEDIHSGYTSHKSTSQAETPGNCLANGIISSKISETVINVAQDCPTSLISSDKLSTSKYSLISGCDENNENIDIVSEPKTVVHNPNNMSIHQSSNMDHSMASNIIQTNIGKEKINCLSSSDKVATAINEGNFDKNVTANKDIVLKNWRQNVKDKLSSSIQNSLQNQELNESEMTRKSSNQSQGISSEVTKLNTNSYNVKKRKRLNGIGLNHFCKLLNKIDWDVTRSISDLGVEEIDCPSENKELVVHDKPNEMVVNKLKPSDNFDVSSLSSTGEDFVTKRKRKRKHKKKVRLDTPIPRKRCDVIPSKTLSLIKGTPKMHIRFQSHENGSPSVENNTLSNEASINFDKTNGKVKILQNLCLDLSVLNENNVSNFENIPARMENELNYPKVLSPCNQMDMTPQQTSRNFSIQSDINVAEESTPQCLSNLLESPVDKQKNSNEIASSNTKYSSNCSEFHRENHRRNESTFQGIALDYTNQNLCLNESNECILISSCNEQKLSDTCQDEALEQAKAALLKAVGFIKPDESLHLDDVQIISVDSNDSCRHSSVLEITESEVFT